MKLILYLILVANVYSNPQIVWNHLKKYEGNTLVKEPGGDFSRYGIRGSTLEEYNRAYNTKYNLNNLKESQALQVFINLYYKKYEINTLNHPTLQLAITDTIYNKGHAGIKLIQRAINKYYMEQVLIVDGIYGSSTKRALENINNIPYYINLLKNERLSYYERLNFFETYKYGWIKRMEALE